MKMKIERLLLAKFCWISTLAVCGANITSECELAAPHAQPADARYRLGVAGDPDLFLTGELYTVSLKGVDSGEGPTPFTGFTIWVEPADEKVDSESWTKDNGGQVDLHANRSLGAFQAYDSQSKLHEWCLPAVVNATAHPKTEIQVIWSAPTVESEICIRLSARVEPGPGEAWSVLARKLCAAPAPPATFTRQPPIVEPCCACDEAKYEVTFEGLWSRNTHPRDFPPEGARAHFGDVIGASHTAQYRVWQEGRVASAGLRRLADDGATTALEKELKAESEHIRTIIKARGISWQQVGSSTFAVFRVDARNHLVSLAVKLAPSPDWIVGVSALELCNSNCTWRRAATLPLYPYDAGTDSGITYTSHRQPTVPAAAVRALRPDWPRDARSPFYSASGEMRPFARLRLTRLRLYEKSCDANPETGGEISREGVSGGACTTHEWGPWSPCSVSCGPGRALRQRHYVWPARAVAETCRVALTDHRQCFGTRRNCRVASEYEPDPAESSGPCAVSAWSVWSPCEGCGVRARSRHYVVPRAYKRCHIGLKARTVMHQAIPCDAGPCHLPPVDPSAKTNLTNFDWFFVNAPRLECPVSLWGDWSPCSARCGRGRRMRTRFYISRDSQLQQEIVRRLLSQWNRQYTHWQGIELPEDNSTADDPELEARVQNRLEACQATLSQQEALCDADNADCRVMHNPQELCSLPALVGPCRGYQERWFYDAPRGVCEPFGYTGCGGNMNNFLSHEDCTRLCSQHVSATSALVTEPVKAEPTAASIKSKFIKLSPRPMSNDLNEVMQKDAPVQAVTEVEQDVDCEMGGWQGWGDCFGECDHAIKLNYRHVLTASVGSGRACPTFLLKSRSCRPAHCRRQHHSATVTTTEESSTVGFNTQSNSDE